MSDARIDTQQIAQLGYSALQAGDSKRAKNLFEQIVASGKADASHWLGLAYACFRTGDSAATLSAVDKALELHPQNLRAILLKADCLTHLGKLGEALKYYNYALKLAASAQNIPTDIQQGLARAQQASDQQKDEYRSFLMDQLKAGGYSPGPSNRRFQQSLDLALGQKEIFYQQPRRFYYPGLPQIQFYEREEFNWVSQIEEKTHLIRAELIGAMSDSSRFSPYVKSGDARPGQNNQGLDDNDKWGALFLWDYGRLVTENAAIFPQTLKALEAAPLPDIAGQAPMVLFSKLAAETRIPPHNGLLNTRLICHLPIIVPENCGALRVGNEVRSWVQGELLIFDDSIEHEAWNNSREERVILLFEVWRPELNEEERKLVTTMLQAVAEYTKTRVRE
jgi:aspartyl/asparaginyl beta-hydroxylase (cupin superfamily)